MYKYNQFYNNDANKDKDNIIKKKNATGRILPLRIKGRGGENLFI